MPTWRQTRADLAADPDDPLLQARHLFRRHLDAEVAPRHHHRIGEVDDLAQPVDRGRLLELGHQPGAPGDQLLGLGHVFRALHEGERDPVGPQIERKGEVAPVLVGERRDRQDGARQVDALAVADRSAGDDRGPREIGAHLLDAQAHAAVVDQHVLSGGDAGEDLGMGQGRAGGVARLIVHVEPEGGAVLEFDLALGKRADAQLGTLEVGDHADRPVELLLRRADQVVARLLLGVLAVAEVEAEEVGAGLE